MTTAASFYGTGRRKTAIARVRLLPGEGEIVVNGRSLDEHFGNAVNEAEVRLPFRVTGTEGGGDALRAIRPRSQRFVYCGALRARLRPYFLRSFIRGSRVRRPAWRSGRRFASGSISRSARAIPWRMAPA